MILSYISFQNFINLLFSFGSLIHLGLIFVTRREEPNLTFFFFPMKIYSCPSTIYGEVHCFLTAGKSPPCFYIKGLVVLASVSKLGFIHPFVHPCANSTFFLILQLYSKFYYLGKQVFLVFLHRNDFELPYKFYHLSLSTLKKPVEILIEFALNSMNQVGESKHLYNAEPSKPRACFNLSPFFLS